MEPEPRGGARLTGRELVAPADAPVGQAELGLGVVRDPGERRVLVRPRDGRRTARGRVRRGPPHRRTRTRCAVRWPKTQVTTRSLPAGPVGSGSLGIQRPQSHQRLCRGATLAQHLDLGGDRTARAPPGRTSRRWRPGAGRRAPPPRSRPAARWPWSTRRTRRRSATPRGSRARIAALDALHGLGTRVAQDVPGFDRPSVHGGRDRPTISTRRTKVTRTVSARGRADGRPRRSSGAAARRPTSFA